jgi:hypothetical protein
MNDVLDASTGKSINEIIDGETIHIFKRLFMDKNLQLTDENSLLFKEYLWFLNDRLKISHLPIISLSRFSRGGIFRKAFKQRDNMLQFYKIFYANDLNVANIFASKTMQMWLDIDVITYLLWSCAIEMPLLNPIIANRPSQLNPMSQIWIYSNIVKDTIVNNEFKKLLAVGNISLQKQKMDTNMKFHLEIIFSNI